MSEIVLFITERRIFVGPCGFLVFLFSCFLSSMDMVTGNAETITRIGIVLSSLAIGIQEVTNDWATMYTLRHTHLPLLKPTHGIWQHDGSKVC